jgi:hypothetical protein
MPKLVSRERVIEANYPSDNEAAVRYVMGIAGGPFFHLAVDHEWADLQRVLADQSAGWVAGLRVRHALNRAQTYDVSLARSRMRGHCQNHHYGHQYNSLAPVHFSFS